MLRGFRYLLLVLMIVLVPLCACALADDATSKSDLISDINKKVDSINSRFDGGKHLDLAATFPPLEEMSVSDLRDVLRFLDDFIAECDRIEKERQEAAEARRRAEEEARNSDDDDDNDKDSPPPPPDESFTDKIGNAFSNFFNRVKEIGREVALRIALEAVALITGQVTHDFKPADEPDINSVRTKAEWVLPASVRYSEACYLCAHNAFSCTQEGWYPYRQQHYGLAGQLEHGVRAFMVDTYLKDGKIVFSHGDLAWQKWMRAQDTLDGNDLPTLEKWLSNVVKFLENNPTEIVTFILEDYVKDGVLYDRVFQDSGASRFVLTEQILYDRAERSGEIDDTGRPLWPSIGWMRKNDKRLVVFTDAKEHSQGHRCWGEYLMPVWQYCVESMYGKVDVREAAVEREERSAFYSGDGEKRYLYIVNWFPTLPITVDFERIFSGWSISNLVDKAREVGSYLLNGLQTGFGYDFKLVNGPRLSVYLDYLYVKGLGNDYWYRHRRPNFIAVDSVHEGEANLNPMSIVQRINMQAGAEYFGPLWWGRTDGELPAIEACRRAKCPSGPGSLDDAGHPNYAALTHVAGNKKNPPVIFVHGLNCNAGAYRSLLYALNNRFAYDEIGASANMSSFYDRYNVFTFEYNSHKYNVKQNARKLRAKIATAVASNEFGRYREEDITFIAHSTGGLVVRTYVAGLGFVPGKLKRLVTLSTPHLGTDIAILGEIARSLSEVLNIKALDVSGQCGADLVLFSDLQKQLIVDPEDTAYRRQGRYVLFGAGFDPISCGDRIGLGSRIPCALMKDASISGLGLGALEAVAKPFEGRIRILGQNDGVVPTFSSLMTLSGSTADIQLPTWMDPILCNGEKYHVDWDHDGLLDPYKAKSVFSYILNGFTATGPCAAERVFRDLHMRGWRQ